METVSGGRGGELLCGGSHLHAAHCTLSTLWGKPYKCLSGVRRHYNLYTVCLLMSMKAPTYAALLFSGICAPPRVTWLFRKARGLYLFFLTTLLLGGATSMHLSVGVSGAGGL